MGRFEAALPVIYFFQLLPVITQLIQNSQSERERQTVQTILFKYKFYVHCALPAPLQKWPKWSLQCANPDPDPVLVAVAVLDRQTRYPCSGWPILHGAFVARNFTFGFSSCNPCKFKSAEPVRSLKCLNLWGKEMKSRSAQYWNWRNYPHAQIRLVVPKTAEIQGDTDHAGSGRDSRDSRVGLYWAAQGSKTEQSVSSANNTAAAIMQIMWLTWLFWACFMTVTITKEHLFYTY